MNVMGFCVNLIDCVRFLSVNGWHSFIKLADITNATYITTTLLFTLNPCLYEILFFNGIAVQYKLVAHGAEYLPLQLRII